VNQFRKLVTLDANMVRVSRDFGEAISNWYASPDGMKSASRSRSGQWGAESDPIRQGQGKAGEYAVALLFGLDPKTTVKRSIGRADNGSDVILNSSLAIDVKTTPARKRWLIWSLELNELYWDKKFDVLISVSINENDWSQCWIEGWLTKWEFFDRKKIADGINDQNKLTDGTWFVEKNELSDINIMLKEYRQGFVGYDEDGHFVRYCHCGKWGAFSVGYFPRQDKLGTWYCATCNPNQMSNSRRSPDSPH
jgi:hypothetical protein